VVTGYNCIARLNHDEKGCFSPFWKPPFIDEIISEDRCHLNGLCMEEGELAFVTMVSQTNKNAEWKEHRDEGGIIMDVRNNEVVASGLCMPHTPLLRDGVLWFLEAGKGNLCRIDLKKGKEVERVLWRPGFLRGLHFYKNYAFICSSAPRDETFDDLPLEKELEEKDLEPRCALDVIDVDTMELAYSITITGHVKEIYDVALLENCRQPLLHGFLGEEIQKIIVLGEDESDLGALNIRFTQDSIVKVG